VSRFSLIGFLLATSLATVSMQATAITYPVNRTVGAGSVAGTIETDGTIGALLTSNIVDWNLVISDGTDSFNLLGPLSGGNSETLVFGVVTATPTGLQVDTGGPDSVILFQSPNIGSGELAWCIAVGPNCGGPGDPENIEIVLVTEDTQEQIELLTPGIVTFAGSAVSASPATPVPALPLWALGFVAGIAGLIGSKNLRKAS
jgi:hypothetical protein